MKTYCLVCKNYTDNSNSRVVKNKQRLMLNQMLNQINVRSNCSVCRNNKNMFTSNGSGLPDSLGLNTPQNRMKNVLCNAFR